MRIAILLLLAALAVSGCIRQPDNITQEERAAVYNYAGPIVDSMMAGFNDGNYTRFSANFGNVLQSFMTEDHFHTLVNDTTKELGLYVSKGQVSLEKDNGLYTLTYVTDWEKKDVVQLSVMFRVDDPYHKVESFAINSSPGK
ncbi:MAG: hypothetical protein ABIH90_03275 [Candidatus Aenigmatarchaeota archaeon]